MEASVRILDSVNNYNIKFKVVSKSKTRDRGAERCPVSTGDKTGTRGTKDFIVVSGEINERFPF